MNKKISIYHILIQIVVLLIFYTSKTVYGGQLYSIEFILILGGFSFVLYMRRPVLTKNYMIFFLFAVFILLTGIMNGNDNYLTDLKNIFILFSLCIFASSISGVAYLQAYIRVVCFFCLISLVFFIASLLNRDFVLAACNQVSVTEELQYIANPVYTFARADNLLASLRNFGPFWEPGAFQGFVIIAILILLCSAKQKNIMGKFTLLGITLLTTQSTTGYICLLIILVVFRNSIFNIYFKKSSYKNIYKLIFVALVVFMIGMIFNSNTIQNKFTNTNWSYITRKKDFYNSLQVMAINPLWGLGRGTRIKEIYFQYNLVHNSNGVFHMFNSYGIPFGVVYLLFIVKWFGQNLLLNLNTISKCACIAILILLLSTEGLCFLPFYLSMLFSYKQDWGIVKSERLEI